MSGTQRRTTSTPSTTPVIHVPIPPLLLRRPTSCALHAVEAGELHPIYHRRSRRIPVLKRRWHRETREGAAAWRREQKGSWIRCGQCRSRLDLLARGPCRSRPDPFTGRAACGSGSEEKREREERERGMRKGSGSTVRPGRRGLSEKSPMRCFMQIKDNLQIFSSLHKNKIYIRHLYEKYPNGDSVVGL